jgi:hypothetical protein
LFTVKQNKGRQNMTTLSQEFLRSIVLVCGFRPRRMVAAQAGLLLIGLREGEFTAAQLPAELGGKNLSGCAAGALVAEGLLTVVGRVKSPVASSKGRKLNLFRITCRETARAWLRANDVADVTSELRQPELAIA